MRGVVSGFAAAVDIAIHPFHDRRCDRDDLAVTEIQWENSIGAIAPIRELRRRTLIRTNSRPELDPILVVRKRPDVRVHSSETDAVTAITADASADAHFLVDVSTLETVKGAMFVRRNFVW
jgi:hypothetical protein